MDTQTIINNALNLSPAERIIILEALSKSLSEPDAAIDKAWREEVENRYKDYLEGRVKTIAYEEMFKNYGN